MITRMEITYRSKNPCNVEPAIFTTGGYAITQNGVELNFDFEDMTANTRFENGYLFIDSLQRNLEESIFEGVAPEIIDRMLKSAKKEDFTEMYNECFTDSKEEQPIELIAESITFYDFSASGSGAPIEVGGGSFNNLI